MGVRVSCGRSLIKENHFLFHIVPYKLLISADPITHFGCPLFKAVLKGRHGERQRWQQSPICLEEMALFSMRRDEKDDDIKLSLFGLTGSLRMSKALARILKASSA